MAANAAPKRMPDNARNANASNANASNANASNANASNANASKASNPSNANASKASNPSNANLLKTKLNTFRTVNGKVHDVSDIMQLYKILTELKGNGKLSISAHAGHLQQYTRVMKDPFIKDLAEQHISNKQFNKKNMDALLWMQSQYYASSKSTNANANSQHKKIKKIKSNLGTATSVMSRLISIPNLREVMAWIHKRMASEDAETLQRVIHAAQQTEQNRSTLTNLPSAILQEIAIKLDTPDAYAFSCLNKASHQALSDETLRTKHPTYYLRRLLKILYKENEDYISDDDSESSNGLSSNGSSSNGSSSNGSSSNGSSSKPMLSSLDRLFKKECASSEAQKQAIVHNILKSQAHLNLLCYRCSKEKAFLTLFQILQYIPAMPNLHFPLEIAVLIIMICDTDENMLNIYLEETQKAAAASAPPNRDPNLTLSKILLHCENINQEAMANTSGCDEYGHYDVDTDADEEDPYIYTLERFKLTCYLPVSVLTSLLNVWKIPIANGDEEKRRIEKWLTEKDFPFTKPVVAALRSFQSNPSKPLASPDSYPYANCFNAKYDTTYSIDGSYAFYISELVKEQFCLEIGKYPNSRGGGRIRCKKPVPSAKKATSSAAKPSSARPKTSPGSKKKNKTPLKS